MSLNHRTEMTRP